MREKTRDSIQKADYHSQRLQVLTKLQGESSVPSGRDFPRGFVNPAQIFKTAWDAATETGAVAHMDYAIVLELSKIYARQESYESQSKVTGEILYRELFRGGMGAVLENHANLAVIIRTFSYREQQLLELYDETLVALGEQPAGE